MRAVPAGGRGVGMALTTTRFGPNEDFTHGALYRLCGTSSPMSLAGAPPRSRSTTTPSPGVAPSEVRYWRAALPNG
jgi:hypothetical protein